MVYLAALPHNLGQVDEANFLYEAKRIFDGEVLYRDIFELVTPLSLYAVAVVYRIFGVDMGAARVAMAVVHGSTVLAIYLACRTVNVRTSLAAAVALAYVAVCQPAWPYASPHWFSTSLTTLLFLLCLSPRWRQARWSFALGLVNGILIGVQQQRGTVVAVGVGALFLLVHLVDQRFGQAGPWRQVFWRMAAFAAGVLIVVVPLLGTFVILAGSGPMFTALVRFPLVNYRHAFHSQWAQALAAGYARYTFPLLLRFLPIVFAALLPRMAMNWLRRRDRDELRTMAVIAVFAGASVLSIAYYPDLIHIAFIAPVFFVAIAETAEWALAVGGHRVATVAGPLIALAVIAGVVWQFQRTMTRSWHEFPVPYDSRFGRIDFVDSAELRVIDTARTLVEQSPNKDLFCYPSIAGPYLMTGGRNPTPYQFFTPHWNDPEQLDDILATLETRQVPLVIIAPLLAGAHDPVTEYVGQHYGAVRTGKWAHIWLFTRNSVPSAPPG